MFYTLDDVKEVNPYYTDGGKKLKLKGFWDVTFIRDTWKNCKEFEWNKTPEQTRALRNAFGMIAMTMTLKNSKEVHAIPIFTGYHPEFQFDKEISDRTSNPWILFFQGNDDSSYGMRFATEADLEEFLTLGPDVGELPLAWFN